MMADVILITGASGFIGSALIKRLADRYASGDRAPLPRPNANGCRQTAAAL